MTTYTKILNIACIKGNLNVIRDNLYKKSVNFNINKGLLLACKYNRRNVIAYLIEAGADPKLGFNHVCWKGDLDLIDYLITLGADVDSGMIFSCKINKIKSVKYLVEKWNASYFNTGLEVACSKGHLDVVKYMIEKGAAAINVGLLAACGNVTTSNSSHTDVIKYLIEEYKAGELCKGFYLVCERGNMDLVKYMIEKGVSNINGGLYAAAAGAHLDVIKYLVEEHNADEFTWAFSGVYLLNKQGSRVLQCMRYLIEECGVKNIEVLNVALLDITRCYGIDLQLVKYLLEHGATVVQNINYDNIQALLNIGVDRKLLGSKAVIYTAYRDTRNTEIKRVLSEDTTVSNDVMSVICSYTEY